MSTLHPRIGAANDHYLCPVPPGTSFIPVSLYSLLSVASCDPILVWASSLNSITGCQVINQRCPSPQSDRGCSLALGLLYQMSVPRWPRSGWTWLQDGRLQVVGHSRSEDQKPGLREFSPPRHPAGAPV